jgi:tetratricopeptide (TPR) repeat protein
MVQSKIETFTAMLAEQPENAMIWYGLASEQYRLENWAEAAKSLRQVVSLNQDYTRLSSLRVRLKHALAIASINWSAALTTDEAREVMNIARRIA